MNCIECKTTNPDGNLFCGQCGAELGRTLDETVRKKGFRDRQATEMEITDAVASRMMKWVGWIGGIAALIVASFGFALGLIYHDTRAALDVGKTHIETAVAEGKSNINTAVSGVTKEISTIKETADDLDKQVTQLKLHISSYKEVNSEIEKLQKQFHGQMEDLSKLDLKVHSLETVRSASEPDEPGQFGIMKPGCQPVRITKESKVVLCAQGSPLLFYQRSSNGDLWPVSSGVACWFSRHVCQSETGLYRS